MAFTDDILASIKERIHISEIVGEFVRLKRSGKNFVGLCPFHSEKTPSFSVRDEEGTFHCFGCGKKGSVFNFVMEMRGFTFPESVRYLAKQAGIVLPEEGGAVGAQSGHTAELREIVLAACEAFQESLWQTESAMEYTRGRGLSEETLKIFHLGFAPRSWDFIETRVQKRLRGKGVLPHLCEEEAGSERLRERLLELGLLKQKRGQDGEPVLEGGKARVYDAFRERLIFPITRSDGRPVAFGGRIVVNDAGAPKYINSPESALYSKRRSLFGLPQALPAARRERHVYLVEGNMDVLSLYQVGITSVVATCGTAVTAQHAEMLKRFVDAVTVVFDADDAGRKAAAQCFPVFLNSGLDIEVVLLPDGLDPDSAARTLPIAELRSYLETNRRSGARVYLDALVDEEAGSGELTPAASGRVATRYAQTVAQVRNAVEKEFLLRLGAERLGVSADSFDQLVREETRKTAPKIQTVIAAPAERRVPTPARPERRQKTTDKSPVSRTREQFDLLFRQLIVAVLCEPEISETVVKVRELNTGEPELDAVRDRVFGFIRDFRESGLPGVFELVEQHKRDGTALQPEAVASIRALLAAHGLEGFGLLQEAVRQTRTGGAKPAALAEESSAAADRLSSRLEVEQLKAAESQSADEAEHVRRVQAKLQKRRDLERLKTQREA